MPATPPVPPMAILDQPHAPFIYLDGTSNWGVGNGIINVTLVANRFLAQSDGQVRAEAIVQAHLRCSLAAAIDLRKALDSAILAATPSQGQAN